MIIRSLRIILFLCFFPLVGFVCMKAWQRSHQLSHVPDTFNIFQVTYSQEKLYGLGPGGNETGLIVYKLPEDIAVEINQQGIDYLKEIMSKSGNTPGGKYGYGKWEETPLCFPKPDPKVDGEDCIPNLSRYLNRYGFGIIIKSEIKQQINEAISKKGSYFSYRHRGRGLLIVIPSKKRLVYAYSG